MKKITLILLVSISIASICNAQNNDKPTTVYGKNGKIRYAWFDTELKSDVPSGAKEFFRDFLGTQPEDGYTEIPHEPEREGFIHQHYDQYYKGIKVEGAGYNFHYQNGKMYLAHGYYVQIDGINTTPSITPKEAMLAFANYKNIPASAVNEFKSTLIIKEIVTVKGNDTIYTPILAYKIHLQSNHKNNDEFGYIDAHTGKVTFTESLFDSTSYTGTFETRYNGTQQSATEYYNSVYNLADFSRGAIIRTKNNKNQSDIKKAVEITDADNFWSNAEHSSSNNDMGLDVHWTLQKIYDHLRKGYNKNSFNNYGFRIDAYIKYADANGKDNAYWHRGDSVLLFCEGESICKPYASIDIIGHEFGHGITFFQMGWGTMGEQRQMNEGLSDIWGAIFEHRIRPHNVWLIGEQIMKNNTCIRNIQNPNDPGAYTKIASTYQSTQYIKGDIYVKGGVFSRWFYLLVNGGSGTNDIGNSYTVYGIGMNKAEDLIIEAVFNNYLDNITTFTELRTAMVDAARTLCIGLNGTLVQQVENAWYAVGVGAQPIQISISGPSKFCTSINSTFTLNNYPSSTTISWTKSSNLSFVSGTTGGSVTVKAASSTTSGTGWVQAFISSGGCGTVAVKKDFWVGKPNFIIVSDEVLETRAPGIAIIENSAADPYTFQGVNRIDWSYTGPLTSFVGSLQKATFRAGNTPGQGYIYANAYNSCGTTENRFYYQVVGSRLLSVAPNPASVNITITEVEPANDNIPWVLRLMSGQGAVMVNVTATLPQSISVSGLQPGVYILHARKGQYLEQQVIIIE